MEQNSFVKLGDGDYALQVVGPSTEYVTTITDTSSVTSPSAGTTIAVTPALSPGVWDLEAITYIGGTTSDSLEPTNMRLVVGGAAISRIMNPVPGNTGGVGIGQLRVRYKLSSSATAGIVAVANATTGAVYSGTIIAKRVV